MIPVLVAVFLAQASPEVPPDDGGLDCFPFSIVMNHLVDDYHEHVLGVGKVKSKDGQTATVALFANLEGGTWSIVLVIPQKNEKDEPIVLGCILYDGTRWHESKPD